MYVLTLPDIEEAMWMLINALTPEGQLILAVPRCDWTPDFLEDFTSDPGNMTGTYLLYASGIIGKKAVLDLYPGVSVNHRKRYAEHLKAVVEQAQTLHFHERCLQMKAIPNYIMLADTKGAANFELKYLIESFAISVVGLDPSTQKQKQYEEVKKMEDPNDPMPDDVFPANLVLSICQSIRPTQRCDLCDETFETVWQKNSHRLIVHDATDYKCPWCGKKFTHANELHGLAGHAKSHLPPMYKCLDDNCEKRYTIKSNMILHYAGAHATDVFRCPADGCEETFSAHGNIVAYAFRSHFAKEHVGYNKSCARDCGRMFHLQSDATYHETHECRLRTAEDKEAVRITCGLADCTHQGDIQAIAHHRASHDKCKRCQQVLPLVQVKTALSANTANAKHAARRAHFVDHCSNAPLDIDGDIREHFDSAGPKAKMQNCYLHPSCRFSNHIPKDFAAHQKRHEKCPRCPYIHSLEACARVTQGPRKKEYTPAALILREEHTKDCLGLSAEVRETARLQYERKNAPRTPLASINANAPPKTKQGTLSFGTSNASNKKRKLD